MKKDQNQVYAPTVEENISTNDSLVDNSDGFSDKENDVDNNMDNVVDKNEGASAETDNNSEQTDDGNSSTEENNQEDNHVKICFTGDVLLDQKMDEVYEKADRDLNAIVDKKVANILNKADLCIINQEFPFSDRGTKAPDKQFTFRVKPEYVEVLLKMGVDIATLANNHSLDYGEEALIDTLATLKEAGIEYSGAGENLTEASKIIYKEINGIKIAFLSASRVIPVTSWNAGEDKPGLLTTYDPTTLCKNISSAKEEADIVLVYVHWGLERKTKPESYQRVLAQNYIDAGADVVIGAHSHCLQGIEFYKEKPVVYSLGNFVFGSKIQSTVILNVDIDKDKNVKLSVVPCKSSDYKTSLVTGKEEKKTFYKDFNKLMFNVTVDNKGNVIEKR